MFIAIPVSLEGAQYAVNATYVRYVSGAGFTPILVTPENNILDVAARCDGLILPGGKDLDPIYYGEDNDNAYHVDPAKGAFERKLFYAFAEMGKPVFGICRGFQLIFLEYCAAFRKMTNAKFGYAQHISSHNQTSASNAPRPIPSHMVNAMKFLLYNQPELKDINGTMLPVNSMHHQAGLVKVGVDRSIEITKHFVLLAWTSRGADSFKGYLVVEAFSLTGWLPGRIMAVQWHPEELNDTELIRSFFDRAEKTKALINVAT